MIRTRIQSDYVDLRGQLIVMLILAVAIALRSMFIAGGEAPRGPVDIPTANEAQHDATCQECPGSGGLR